MIIKYTEKCYENYLVKFLNYFFQTRNNNKYIPIPSVNSRTGNPLSPLAFLKSLSKSSVHVYRIPVREADKRYFLLATRQLGQLFIYYTPPPKKRFIPFVFSTYQAFKNPEGIVSRKNLAVEISSCFDSQNKLEKNSLIGLQGDYVYICFLLLVSYFNMMVICFNIW